MSKFRVEVDMSFNTEQDAIDFLNAVEQIKTQTYKPTGLEKIVMFRALRYHECFHDEIPPKQCGNYVAVDFDKPPAVHQKKV